MAMRFDAGGYKRRWACHLLDLDRTCGFGGEGWWSDWGRVRSGADRDRRQREILGRIGKRWGFERRGLEGLLLRHFWGWTTLGEVN